VDAVVAAAGVAKGTFYYHFQGIDELAAGAGAKLGESFDERLTPARLEVKDPIKRLRGEGWQ
jgi:AcrR family transcriptional regulator